jgi:hypothetical protein
VTACARITGSVGEYQVSCHVEVFSMSVCLLMLIIMYNPGNLCVLCTSLFCLGECSALECQSWKLLVYIHCCNYVVTVNKFPPVKSDSFTYFH